MTGASIRVSATMTSTMQRSLAEQPARFRRTLLTFLQRAGWLVAGDMKRIVAPQLKHAPQLGAPHPGGALVASIKPFALKVTRGGTGGMIGVGPNVPYADFVNDGTAPHTIRPKNTGGTLRFISGGRIVYARQVHHPGTTGYHFIEETAEVSAPKVEALAARMFLGDGGISL